MENNNGQKKEKGGFWSSLSGIFRGGSSAMGGSASSGRGTAGGLFATKAGIVGMVLGGATIAAGVGVVYNFVGSSSKPVYSPELFQNSYYEEESAAAGLQRAQSKDRSSASASTLDMFSEQAKKDGVSGLAAEAGGDAKSAASGDAAKGAAASADSPAAAAGAPGAPGAADGGAKLKAAPSFGGSKGGSGGGGSSSAAMPRMQNGGGLSGGIGGQFASMALAGKGKDGRTSAMGGSLAARVNGSPKYAVPNFKRSGAYGQAKFASALGNKASYSADGATVRNSAEQAFSGETTGTGDVAGGDSGAGMGGAGISNGSSLKSSDPSLNSNTSTPAAIPSVPPSTDDSPWNKLLTEALWYGLGAIGGIILTSLFAKAGKAEGFWGIAAFVMAILCCLAAIACAVKIILIGVNLMQGNGKPGDKDYFAPQTMYGIGLIAAGTMLIVKALEAVSGAGSTPEKPAVAPSGAGAGASGATGAAAGSPLVPATTGPFSAFSGLSNIFQGM